MNEKNQHKILDHYFGTINGIENSEEIKQKLALLTWELKEELELIEEREKLLESLKEKKKVMKYIECCNSRMELLDIISSVAEEDKQKIIPEVTQYSVQIAQLESTQNVILYREHEAKLAYLNTRLKEYIGKEFESLKEYYKPIYVTDKLEKIESKSGYSITFYSHDVFSRKQLVCTTKPSDITDLKQKFCVVECKKEEPQVVGNGDFYISEKMIFPVKPELWLQYPSKEFEGSDGDAIVKKYLYPKK